MMNKADSSPVPELVIIPFPGKGHLASALEFAKHFLRHHDQLSVTILVIPQSVPLPSTETTADDDDRIKCLHLPRVEPGPEFNYVGQVDTYKPHVKDVVANIVSRPTSVRLLGVVIDMFCTSMIDVANVFDVPSYLFYASGAASLGYIRRVPAQFQPADDSEAIVASYAIPVPAYAPPPFSRTEVGHATFRAISQRFRECKGIFVNTFFELEPHAVKSFLSGDEFPPVYTVGPLLDLTSLERKSTVVDDDDKAGKIMRWLDDQPSSTVVLLCFGSLGCFRDPSQLKEIALGLERTGQRFLWSVRKATSPGVYSPREDYKDYDDIMPEGFLERIGDRGMVCGWVPQVEVLAHPAVGGFVSHCGWNSILESLWFGVPIAAWPMYAEQQLNAFQMVKELELAVEVKLDYNMDGGGLVMADDIEKAVTCLMDSDSKMRKKVKEMSEKSREAVTNGGSAYVSFQRLMNDLFENISSK